MQEQTAQRSEERREVVFIEASSQDHWDIVPVSEQFMNSLMTHQGKAEFEARAYKNYVFHSFRENHKSINSMATEEYRTTFSARGHLSMHHALEYFGGFHRNVLMKRSPQLRDEGAASAFPSTTAFLDDLFKASGAQTVFFLLFQVTVVHRLIFA